MVFVIPVARALDLKRAASASGNKRVELLPLKDLTNVTGYLRGGCSPIGMKKRFPDFPGTVSAKEQKTHLRQRRASEASQILVEPRR